MKETIGKNIKRIREIKEISQADLAERVKITPAMLSMIESGKRLPSILVLTSIATGLGVKPGDLFD